MHYVPSFACAHSPAASIHHLQLRPAWHDLVMWAHRSTSPADAALLPLQVEVMKMMMPLLTPAAGVISFLKPEGAALGPGDLIGRLQLDDPNAVVGGDGGSIL
jgi:hypothetical protein